MSVNSDIEWDTELPTFPSVGLASGRDWAEETHVATEIKERIKKIFVCIARVSVFSFWYATWDTTSLLFNVLRRTHWWAFTKAVPYLYSDGSQFSDHLSIFAARGFFSFLSQAGSKAKKIFMNWISLQISNLIPFLAVVFLLKWRMIIITPASSLLS